MRDLALKVLGGEKVTGFDVAEVVAEYQALPFASELLGVVYNFSGAVTNAHSADIVFNGTDSKNTDIDFPAGSTSGFAAPDQRYILEAGDRITLRSNGENAAPDNYDATFAYIFKPLSPRPVGEVWVGAQDIVSIQGASFAINKASPFAASLTGVGVSIQNAINDDVELSIYADDANTGKVIPLPDTTIRGFFVADSSFYCKAGARLNLGSDGGGSSGDRVYLTWVLQPTTTSIPAGWEYCPFIDLLNLHVATGKWQQFVAPCHGKIRELVTHWSEPISTTPSGGATFKLEVNGNNPSGNPIYRFDEDTRDNGGFSEPIENQHHVYVRQGDLITVETNGEQDANTNVGCAGIWIEPMGQLTSDLT